MATWGSSYGGGTGVGIPAGGYGGGPFGQPFKGGYAFGANPAGFSAKPGQSVSWQANPAERGDVYNMLKERLDQVPQTTFSQEDLGRVGGEVTARPDITISPIFTEEQIQKQINLQRAQNDLANIQLQKQIGERAASRGFGTASPLAQSLQSQAALEGARMNTELETQLRTQMAAQNAAHLLATQQAGVQRAGQIGQEDVARRNQYLGYLDLQRQKESPIIAALTKMVEPQQFSVSQAYRPGTGEPKAYLGDQMNLNPWASAGGSAPFGVPLGPINPNFRRM